MPRAFLLEEGLDWDTFAESFWAWLDEARRVMEGGVSDDRVSRMVESQRPRIDAYLEEHGGSDQDRFALYASVALLGVGYAATEKLAAALKERGVLEPRPKPSFDTLP